MKKKRIFAVKKGRNNLLSPEDRVREKDQQDNNSS